MPTAWLSTSPPQAELVRSLNNNHAAYLVAFGVTRGRELHSDHKKQMEEGQWSLRGEQKAAKTRLQGEGHLSWNRDGPCCLELVSEKLS